MSIWDNWFHRGPCCVCGICGSNECYVYNRDGAPLEEKEIHICARGCDGPGPEGQAKPL